VESQLPFGKCGAASLRLPAAFGCCGVLVCWMHPHVTPVSWDTCLCMCVQYGGYLAVNPADSMIWAHNL
jgi:hypothetical protein